jgi:hypothetical protein
MPGGPSLALISLFAVGCTFPTRSAEFSCFNDSDCEGLGDGRVCRQNFCVVGDDDGSDGGIDLNDGTPVDSTPVDMVDPFEAVKASCVQAGYDQDPGTGSVYRVVATGDDWLAAQADCKNDVTGATHLIVLSSDTEVTFMKTKLGWVGLHDRDAEAGSNAANFKNVTGELDDLRPFDGGQPDNGGGNENCVQMKTTDGLDDDQCGNNHRYVCECDGKTSTP